MQVLKIYSKVVQKLINGRLHKIYETLKLRRLYSVSTGQERVNGTEYIFYCKRAILFLSSSKILTPHAAPSPSPPGESVLPRRAERGMGPHGGSIFWKTREIGGVALLQ